MRALSRRFGEAAKAAQQLVEAISDAPALETLFDAALDAPTLEAFIEQARTVSSAPENT